MARHGKDFRQVLTAFAVVCSTAAGFCAGVDTALAQALDLDQPEIEAGEREIRSVNIGNFGYRAGSAGSPRSSHEVSASYSPRDWFKLTAHADVENVIVDGTRLDHLALETLVGLRKAREDGGLALSWFTSIQLSTDELSTNSLLFGPVIKLSSGKASLTLNPYFEDTFGRNRASGIASIYAWQGKYELNESVAIGIEGFGKIESLGDAPVWNEQDHRFGPGVFYSWDGDDKRKFGLDAGVLVGLTDAAPDVTFKLNFGITQ
ncbi:MAG: transporter [Hyphomicrobium sp.]